VSLQKFHQVRFFPFWIPDDGTLATQFYDLAPIRTKSQTGANMLAPISDHYLEFYGYRDHNSNPSPSNQAPATVESLDRDYMALTYVTDDHNHPNYYYNNRDDCSHSNSVRRLFE
jgi:hypothetical protein